MTQDGADGGGLRDAADELEAAGAAWAGEDVEFEGATHHRGPLAIAVAGSMGGSGGAGVYPT